MPPQDTSTPSNLKNALAIETGISRPPMNQKLFEEEFGQLRDDAKRIPLRSHVKRAARGCFQPCSSPRNFIAAIVSFVPILQWLPEYNIRECLPGDLVGGITTAIVHVPTGLAYAALAGVDPVYGLYSSCFPAFFYMLFGTSRHNSLGSFAVISLMAGISNDNIMRMKDAAISNDPANSTFPADLSTIQVATTLTFAIGIIQFAAGLLRLDFLASYFSDPLVSGFTTGAAVHVAFAQVGDLFGLTGLPKASGPGYLFRRSWDITLAAIDRTNYVALLISVITIAILHCGREYLSPVLKKKGLKLPVPYDLFVMLISTAISAALDLQHTYDVPIVGHIPTGPPTPALPVFAILPDCLLQSFGMVAVAVATHISLAKMYSKQLGYAVDARQEFYALGASSMLGSLFSVYPIANGFGRTAVNVASGTKTQLSTLISCSLLMVIILWVGHLLEALPRCILACVIIVALQSMFKRCDELKALWRISRIDLAVWIVSFSSTVVIDVMEGMTISIAFVLLTVVFRSQWPKWANVIGAMSNDSTVPQESSLPHPSVCVFRFDGPLIFTNTERFMNKVKATIDEWEENTAPKITVTAKIAPIDKCEVKVETSEPAPRFFILDCTSIAYVDFMGVKALAETKIDMEKRGVTAFLAAVNQEVRVVLDAQGRKFSEAQIFPTVHDALSIAAQSGSTTEALANEEKKGPADTIE